MLEFKLHTLPGQIPRQGTLTTLHGQIETPIFMPVGTNASVKSLSSQDLEQLGAQIILANNYHLSLRPGSAQIKNLGGIHHFMNWPHPILTDSGGFQVFSLNKEKGSLVKVTSEGVKFKSHLDGRSFFWTPEDAIASQIAIGADIIMPLDICTPDNASHSEAKRMLDITHQWLIRCVDYWRQSKSTQALFGIVQGGLHKDLRQESAKFIADLDLPGIAIGGETIGYNMTGTEEVLNWITNLLPENKPRYTMGVGLRPSDLIRVINCGIDMFDCVAPTRLARNGSLYVSPKINPNERIDISKVIYSQDDNPIDPECKCQTCTQYSAAYLYHLFKCQELLFYRLASIHNLHQMISITKVRNNKIT